MSNSIDFMMLELESRMLTKLSNTSTLLGNGLSDGESTDGASFESLLSGAIEDIFGTDGASAVNSANSIEATNSGGVSDNLIGFIENHEGYAATAYRGVDSWNQTIGYGHVVTAGENFGALSQTQAENLLKSDLTPYENSVRKEFKDTNLNQGQFDALVSFCYGLGTNCWSKTPKLVSDIKSGASADVIKNDFVNCSYCGGKLVQGLVNRRSDEADLFNYGVYNKI